MRNTRAGNPRTEFIKKKSIKIDQNDTKMIKRHKFNKPKTKNQINILEKDSIKIALK